MISPASGSIAANAVTPETAVDIRDLRIRYGDVEVVRGVSLSVGAGEIVSLLGPSGCGKTTTLRAIAGFVAPESGEVRLGGHDVTDVVPNHRNIGMVFQGYALFPHLTVFDNVAYGLRMRSVPRAELADRVARALSLVKLSEYAQRRPRQLSGGQQQRVAIARALVIEPKVLLLDEPLSNLDAKLRNEMRVELRRLLKSTHVASIFVTHDQEEAMVLSDRIVLMNGGEVAQEGSPREIYQQPRSLFAAAFVGAANFLRGVAVESSEAGAALVDLGGVRVRGTVCGDLVVGAPATVVVKHERVRLSLPDGAPTTEPECLFESADFVGANLHLHCTFRGQKVVGLVPATAGAFPRLEPGDTLRLGWDESDALVFTGHSPQG
jgi:putative spermidine/putrescine transport system ATP-binding protein